MTLFKFNINKWQKLEYRQRASYRAALAHIWVLAGTPWNRRQTQSWASVSLSWWPADAEIRTDGGRWNQLLSGHPMWMHYNDHSCGLGRTNRVVVCTHTLTLIYLDRWWINITMCAYCRNAFQSGSITHSEIKYYFPVTSLVMCISDCIVTRACK